MIRIKFIKVLCSTVTVILILQCGGSSGGSTSVSSSAETYNQTISFSGYMWDIKFGTAAEGPGPNIFSNSSRNVYVDANGYLHLAITKVNGVWKCAEIMSQKSFGYGNYEFDIETPADSVDKNVVLGLFTWDDDAPDYYREIDVEISRWGDDRPYPNSQYVVQPWDTAGNIHRFNIESTIGNVIHSFVWKDTGVNFLTKSGSASVQSWSYVKNANYPVPGNEKVHLNVWLLEKSIPSDGKEQEVVIRKFTFTP